MAQLKLPLDSLNWRNLLAAAIAAILVVGAFYVNRKMPEVTPADSGAEASLPRYTVYNAHWTRLGSDGKPTLLGTADSVDYFDDQSSQLIKPKMTAFSQKAKTPWVLSAPTGHTPPHQRRVYLDDPVVANGSWPDGLPVTVTTTWAWIDSDMQQFFTDAKVVMLGDLRHGTAVGMLGDWKEPATLHLLHDVKMTYVPPKRRR